MLSYFRVWYKPSFLFGSAKAASRNVYLSSEISEDFESGGGAASGIGMRHSEGAVARQSSGRNNSSMLGRDRDPAGSCSQRLQSLWTAALQRWPRVWLVEEFSSFIKKFNALEGKRFLKLMFAYRFFQACGTLSFLLWEQIWCSFILRVTNFPNYLLNKKRRWLAIQLPCDSTKGLHLGIFYGKRE